MNRSIKNAPKDGTVILTDCGYVRFIDPESEVSSSGYKYWILCNIDGDIHYSNNEPIICHPKLWKPIQRGSGC